MKIVIIGTGAQETADKVIAYAEAHRLSRADLQRLMVTGVPAAEHPEFCCIIPAYYRCAFTIEDHPSGWCRHLSVAIPKRGKVASTQEQNYLMSLFGFFGGIESADGRWLEDIGGPMSAVNIVQRYAIDATPREFQS